MSRGRSNWLVEIEYFSGESAELYGPYTEQQANSAVERIKRHIARELEARDQDSSRASVICYEIGRWQPWEITPEPVRPPCPRCGIKLDVWTSGFTDETFGHCNDPDCDAGEFSLAEENGRWVIVEGQMEQSHASQA